jgi:GWxTD domain-containing protein
MESSDLTGVHILTKRLVTSILLLSTLFTPGVSQVQRYRAVDKEKSPLEITATQFPTSQGDSVTTMVFTQVPLDRIVFVKSETDFIAAYELSIFAVDEDEMVRETRIWREEVIESKFTNTQSPDQYHLSRTDLVLIPGEYELVVTLVDEDNRQSFTTREELSVTAYPVDQIAIGDALLLSRRPDPADRLGDLVPYVGNRIGDSADSFYVYFIVRNPGGEALQVPLEYSLDSEDDSTAVISHTTIMLDGVLSPQILSLATSELKGREYELKIEIPLESHELQISVPIHVTWAGFTGLIADIDEAIEQTRYVATRAQLQQMRKAPEEGRREAFLAFWRGIDPTPETPRNELMDQYYIRVAYANAHFRSFQAGWETDMGMVHIIYGQPDDIERHPFDVYQKPYQVWYYYDTGWQFVFVDVNMFGDYRLVSPLYPGRSF